jgi:glycosyltransferase involved in cell wall biosynthesis
MMPRNDDSRPAASQAALVSVIIPNYNNERYLPLAIDSALRQTYAPTEVIVVDDGSTDGSGAVLERYGDRLHWIRQRNQGVSAARNRGIRESRGELVAFLDADDAWEPTKLARQVELLRKPSVGMAYTGLTYVDESGEPLGANLSGCRGHVLRDLALLRGPGVPASGSSALVRRECFDRVGFFDLGLSTSADWDMWRRIACHYEIDLVQEPLTLYRLHHGGMHRGVDLFERDMMRAFARMFSDPAAEAVTPLRRRCYGNLYMTLCGSYLRARDWRKCLQYAVRGLITWPGGLSYLASFPFRRLDRWFGSAGGTLEPSVGGTD